jgi:integrase/recombinase XerC
MTLPGSKAVQQFLIIAGPDLQAARQAWLDGLGRQRRLSALTVEAYERDTRQFLHFLTGHCGGPPGIVDVAQLRPADLRAFLAARRKDGAGARTLGRGLAGVRSLLRFLEREGLANAAGATVLRAPKQPKSLPKPLTASDARRVVSTREQLAEEPWIAARDAAVLTLLYGSGLRISEALGLDGAALTDPAQRTLRIAGKGGKTRLVPVLPAARQAVDAYRSQCPYALAAGAPLFRGARGGPLNPAVLQRAMQGCAAR